MLALVVLPRSASGQASLGLWDANPAPIVREMRAGIDAYYRFDYAAAMTRFDRVVEQIPNHPVGYFLRAEASWWLFLNDRQNVAARSRLEQNLDRAIDLAKARLKRYPDDEETRFVLGSAYGRRGMLAGTARKVWRAARSAKKARKHLDRVSDLSPGHVDALAAQGLYLYYVGTFGTVTRAASRILFGLRGDREEGLAALDLARNGGTYMRTEAAFFEGLFYLQFEDRPADAELILDELREQYPENLYFGTMAAYARQRQTRFREARALYEEMLDRLTTTRVYGREGESITRLFYGQTLMALGELDLAYGQFVQVVQLQATESDAYPHAHIYLGRHADMHGDRQVAERWYERALQLPDMADSHEVAHRLLDEPFSRAELPALVGGVAR